MSYFPNAFEKVFVVNSFVTTGKTQDLTAGQFGFFDPRTWTAISTLAPTSAVYPKVVLAMGNYHSVDKLGSHGGYKESVKSQVINPSKVYRFWKVSQLAAANQQLFVGWDTVNASSAPKFFCGETYNIRIDLKGSPALRTMGHNLYRTFSVTADCCADVNSPVAVDPVVVMLEFARQINEDPVFSDFINASVYYGGIVDPATYVPLTDQGDIDAAITAFILQTSYVDTVYGTCSFDPRNYFEAEPLVISSVQFVDDVGTACPSWKQLAITEFQAPRMVDGSPDKVIHDLIMFNNYRQEPYRFDVRKRAIENEDISALLAEVNQAITPAFDIYYILHGVDRKYNPTGVNDNDLYLIKICGLENMEWNNFDYLFTNYLHSTGTGVTLEDLSLPEA